MSSVRLRSRGMTPARGDTVGRQPAEGRPCAVADRPCRRSAAGRTDAWGRRGRAQRDLPHHRRTGAGRHGGGAWRHRTCRRSSASPTGRSSCAAARSSAELDRAALSRPTSRRESSASQPGSTPANGSGSAPRRGRQPLGRRARGPLDPHHDVTDHQGGRAMSTQRQCPVSSPAAREPTGGRRALQRRLVPPDQLIRHAMVMVMLLDHRVLQLPQCAFQHLDNIHDHRLAAAPFALIALGQTLVILTGGIDLSVGSVIALCAMAAAATAKGHPGAALALRAGRHVRGAGGRCGQRDPGCQGQRATVHRDAGMLHHGLRTGLRHRRRCADQRPARGLRQDRQHQDPRAPDPGARDDRRHPRAGADDGVGRHTACASTPSAATRVAAQIAGVNAGRILFSVYAISGVLAGISGVMLASRVISGPPNLGQGYELDAIAAVVIGGASLLGGRGSIWGTALGPAAHPDPEQRPGHPGGAGLLAETSSRACSSSRPSRSTCGPPGDATLKPSPDPRLREPPQTKRSSSCLTVPCGS